MISVDTLIHQYPATKKQAARRALSDVSFTVPEGTLCLLSGPNGCGKSTLFRILCGLTLPSAGKAEIDGHDIVSDLAAARRSLGVVFQSPAVDKHLSVEENLRLHAALNGLTGALYFERRTESLAWTDLQDRLNDKVDTLSGGLARQVELAKVMLMRPRVLLLDEPTTGLDPASRRGFLRAVRSLQKSRVMTVLMTSHVFSEVDDVDQIIIMSEGRILANDTPAALMRLVGQEMVIIRSDDPDTLTQKLQAASLTVRRNGQDIQLTEIPQDGALALVGRLLNDFGPEISTIALKKPDLEDVFVEITGKGKGATS